MLSLKIIITIPFDGDVAKIPSFNCIYFINSAIDSIYSIIEFIIVVVCARMTKRLLCSGKVVPEADPFLYKTYLIRFTADSLLFLN